jgi:predicted Zn-dependent peptidase
MSPWLVRSSGLPRLAVSLALAAGSACAPSRPALPPPPAPVPIAQLERWKGPPPLAPDRAALDLKLDTTRVRLDNGLGITVVARPETTTSSVALWVPTAGDWSDGPVSIMTKALYAGTKVGDELMVNPRLDFQAVNVATNAAGTTFRWNVMPDATHKAVELLGAFVTRPAFSPAETRIKLRGSLESIQRFSVSPAVMTRLGQSAFIGEIPTPEEDALSLIKLKLEDLSAIHACSILPSGAELVVTGPVRSEDVTAWARTAFGTWRAGPPEAGLGCERWRGGRPSLTTEAKRLARTQLAIAYVNQPEPAVSILLPAPSVRSEDYLPYVVLARAIFWRALTKDDTLRHAGATYTISAQINDGFGQFSVLEISGMVEPSMARESLRRLVEDNWSLSEDLSEADLDTAKRMLRTELLSDLAYNARFADRILWLLRQGQNPAELASFVDAIARIDIQRARDVAQRWLKDTKPSIVVLAQPQKLVAGLGLDVQVRELFFTKDPQARRRVGATDSTPAP